MGCSGSAPAPKAPEDAGTFHDRYKVGVKLGKGGFSQVREAKKCADNSEWAVKVIDLRSQNTKPTSTGAEAPIDPQARKEAVNEASVWRRAEKHANIVSLADAFMDNALCYFVMEKCESGLLAHLEKGAGARELDERSIGKCLKEMFLAAAHIHALQIVHRDIKPDNFLANNGQVVMCDFGLADVLPKAGGGLSGVFGTAPFMCPEMLKGHRYGEKSDNWSLGVLGYVLLLGQFPYNPVERTSSAMKRVIRDGKVPPSFQPHRSAEELKPSAPAVAFLRALLSRNAEQRPSAEDVLKHPFLTNVDASKELPSMRPMLRGAVKAGAFENRRVDVVDTVDALLSRMQQKAQGADIISQSAKQAQETKASRDKLRKELPDTPSEIGRRPSNGTSVSSNSNAWSTGTGGSHYTIRSPGTSVSGSETKSINSATRA